MKKYVLLALFNFTLAACSTSSTGIKLFDDSVEVEHLIYANHFIFPESQGKTLAGNLKLSFSGTDSVKLVDDIDNDTITTPHQLTHGESFDFNMALGVINRIDLYYAGGLGLKLQLLGNGAKDAKKGDFSLALAANTISSSQKTSTSDTTGSVKKAEATVEVEGTYYALLMGYRTSDKALVYGGPFLTSTEVNKVNVYQTNNTNFTFSGNVASGKSKVMGVNIGVYANKKGLLLDTLDTGFGLEAAYTKAEWTNTFTAPNTTTDNDGFHIGTVVSIGW